ncbi:MAG: DEAD/DEAH box helicase [Ilumatobacteraceae bacterium]
MPSLIEALPPPGADPADVAVAFGLWADESGRPLYPHQEEALLALAGGEHVVLATPTGSGKSLVAMGGIVLALNAGRRAVWTAPIKALVAEKFFELVGLLGAEAVGLATGDAAINGDAPVLVCTAEVLANHALAEGAASPFAFACLDEFHYYADRDRGWAWQVPLLEMTRCQFLLASATLGDMSAITADLERRSQRPVASVMSVDRPTPLFHQWRLTSVADSVVDAVKDGLAPIYLVHSTQAAAIERAQALVSLGVSTRPQREAIAEQLRGERVRKGFGTTLDRLLRNGVGVHHAGMLPRYRRLVERLAGAGLLPVICGTDTLGVGVNIPIRTVLMTSLTKFDGTKVRSFTVREFRQLAGRAGRPGFDPDGHVWVQAPDHVVENAKALSRAGDDPKAQRKAAKSKPPDGFVHYDEATMRRLVEGQPEPLTSRFSITADMVATVLRRADGPTALRHLLDTNHEPAERRRQLKRRAIRLYRSLEAAGVAERLRGTDGKCSGVRVGSLVADGDDRAALRLSMPLAPFAIEVVASFDHDEPSYELDVISVIESILDDPRQVLYAQQNAAKAAAVARMKAEGVPYEERMERLESVSWPQPLHELLSACIDTYRSQHPWVGEGPSPKSIVREMIESGDTFDSFVQRYRLDRSEGLVLRYLTDAWRALDRSLPDDAYTERLEDIIEWLGTLIRATDSTLLDEWTMLAGRPRHDHGEQAPLDPSVAGPPASWRTVVRNAAFGWVELLARRAHGELAARAGCDESVVDAAMQPYWNEHDSIGIDATARSAAYFTLVEEPSTWRIEQTLMDPEDSREWCVVATVDIDEAIVDGAPALRLESITCRAG